MPKVSSWVVYNGERRVLSLKGEPGPITSTALPPPGQPPRRHPFLSAAALAPEEEDRLGRLLEGARSVEEFLDALRRAGYRVVQD